MQTPVQTVLPVTDSSHSGEARRFVADLAARARFPQTDAGSLAVIVTELATNILKHARAGQILARNLNRAGRQGIELIALDRGPGMANVGQCLIDGYSTTGGPGTGLGAVRRLSSEFDLFSLPGRGTAVVARLWPHHRAGGNHRPLQEGVVWLAKSGESVSGDAWSCQGFPDRSLCMVVDGLGHGPAAAAAARQATAIFDEHRNEAPAEIIARSHDALRSTRGAAIAIAEIHPRRQIVRFCGIGNIAGAIVTPEQTRHLVSHNGTVGQEIRKIAEFAYPWTRQSLLVMHTDGLTSRWDLHAYAGLAQRDPSLVAAVLYRDFARGRDDVTVLAVNVRTAGTRGS